MMNSTDLLQQAIVAARSGDRHTAAQLLARVVQATPTSTEAWWWLAHILEDPAQRAYCEKRLRALETSSGPTPPRPEQPRPTAGLSQIVAPVAASVIAVNAPPSSQPASALSADRGPRAATAWLRRGIPIGGCALLVVALVLGVTFLTPYIRLPLAWRLALPNGLLASLSPEETDQYRRQARQMMLAGNYAEALDLYNRVIASESSLGEDYYRRAQTYQAMRNGENDQSVFLTRTTQALADVNRALQLGPVTGDYFALRSSLLSGMAGAQTRSADAWVYDMAALADEQQALALGTADNVPLVWIPHLLVLVGQCQEALDLTRQTLSDWAYDQTTADLRYDLAESELCLGDLEAALADIQAARQQTDADHYLTTHVLILHARGDLEAAADLLDAAIAAAPEYGGDRYYLRALIALDQARYADAAADLEAGALRTWDRGGVYLYVKGRLAIERGDRQSGWEMIQQSEDALSPRLSYLRTRLLGELAQAGLVPLAAPSAITVNLPTAAPLPEPLDLPADRRAPLNPGLAIHLSTGHGPVLSYPSAHRSYHVVYDIDRPTGELVQLTLQVHPLLDAGVLDFEFDVWDQTNGTWFTGRADSSGTFTVADPEPFISPAGDVFFMLVNRGSAQRQVQLMGVTLTYRDGHGEATQVGLPVPPVSDP